MASGAFNGKQDKLVGENSNPPREGMFSSIENNAEIPPVNTAAVTGTFQSRTFGRGTHTSLPIMRSRRVIQAFGITNLHITPSRAHPGDIISISFKATNSSHSTSIYTVTLKINGRIAAADVISLPPRSVLPLSFTITAEIPGYFRVDVNEQTSSYVIYGKAVSGAGYTPAERTLLTTADIQSMRQINDRITEKEYGKKSRKPAGNTNAIQYSINGAGNAIEKGLDKAGDALIFPIVLLVKVINRLRRVSSHTK